MPTADRLCLEFWGREGINLRGALGWHKAVEAAPSATDEWRYPAGDRTCPKEPNDPNQQEVVFPL